jgi:hypothetical protein
VTLALDRPAGVLATWDELTRDRRIVGVAAADAHARLFGVEQLEDSYGGAAAVRMPWYEHMFRAFSITVAGVELTRDPQRDAVAIVDALRAGHVYSTIDALAGPVALSFSASGGAEGASRVTASQGDVLPLAGPIRLHAAVSAAAGSRIVLLRDGREVATAAGPRLDHDAAAEPGVYRVEVRWADRDDASVPWIVSNPIYAGRPAAPPAPAPVKVNGPSREVYRDGPIDAWRIELSARAAGALDRVPTAAGGSELGVRYALGGARSDSPFVALTTPIAGPGDYGRLVFTGRALEPMRVSVQVRAPGGTDGERWARSVYLDDTPREIAIAFEEMHPQGRTAGPRPPLDAIDTLMFVVDMTNTKLGSSGLFWIDDIRLVR